MNLEALEQIKQAMPNLHSASFQEKSLEDLQADRVKEKYAGRFKIYQKDFNKHLFRPHAVHVLMGGLPKPLTVRQTETLDALQLKLDSGKTLTGPQYITYGDLLAKKTAKPILSPGAKTYLKTLFKEITFQRTEELKSKYLDKGIIQEPVSIEALSEFHGVDYEKNEERFENEYLSGEPDIISGNEVIDIKSSWDYTTFPMFDEELENKAYYWQIQAYMYLLEKRGVVKGRICYVLTDTPEQLIYEEKKRVSWKLGLISEDLAFDLPEDLEFEIERNLTYGDIPQEGRIKEFPIEKNEKDIELMKSMIVMARAYLEELNRSLEKRFTAHL